MRRTSGLASVVIAAATALVLTAASTVPFLTPQWVAFAQGRADAQAWTGFAPADLRAATDAILTDLVVGPPDFDVAVGGVAVLSEPERAHMRDVRAVFTSFFAAAVGGLLVVVAAWMLACRGDTWTRPRFWRAVRAGATGLALGILALGVVAFAAFDAAFEVFHRVFFSAGTYNFDPRTYRLTQLFPDAFWSETSIVVGSVILVTAAVVALLASRRHGSIERAPIGRLSEVSR